LVNPVSSPWADDAEHYRHQHDAAEHLLPA